MVLDLCLGHGIFHTVQRLLLGENRFVGEELSSKSEKPRKTIWCIFMAACVSGMSGVWQFQFVMSALDDRDSFTRATAEVALLFIPFFGFVKGGAS